MVEAVSCPRGSPLGRWWDYQERARDPQVMMVSVCHREREWKGREGGRGRERGRKDKFEYAFVHSLYPHGEQKYIPELHIQCGCSTMTPLSVIFKL